MNLLLLVLMFSGEQPNLWKVEHYRLTMGSYSGCLWCDKWEVSEKSKIILPIKNLQKSTDPTKWVKHKLNPGNVAPWFLLERQHSTEKNKWVEVKFWAGYRSANIINSAISFDIKSLNDKLLKK